MDFKVCPCAPQHQGGVTKVCLSETGFQVLRSQNRTLRKAPWEFEPSSKAVWCMPGRAQDVAAGLQRRGPGTERKATTLSKGATGSWGMKCFVTRQSGVCTTL